jgi:hypothetical protein
VSTDGRIPFHDESLLYLQAEEREEAARLSEAWVERLHVASTALFALVGFLVSFTWMGEIGVGLSLVMGLFCLIGLIISRALKMVLGDFYRQFEYREKFALFVVHVTLLVVIRFSVGITATGMLLGILLIMLCFQAIDRIWYGRVYACGAAMMFFACMGGSTVDFLPSAGLVAVWFALLLLSIRFGFVRFRVEEEGARRGVNLTDILRRTIPPAVVPPAVGWIVYVATAGSLQPRPWRVVGPNTRTPGPPRAVNIPVGELLINALIIVVVIVVALLLLNWLDKKLRRRKRSNVEEGDAPASTERRYAMPSSLDDGMAEEQVTGARARILAALHGFSTGLSTAGLARRPAETVEDYFTRLERDERFNAQAPSPFNLACYSEEEVTDRDADEFEEMLERERERLLAALADDEGSTQ